MANSFFDFDTSLKEGLDLKNGEHLLPEDDDCIEDEEASYDALNDETFGACDPLNLDDWEQQHEQFAEINESSRHPNDIENSLSQLVNDSSEDEAPTTELLTFPKDSSVWAYTPTKKNGDIFNSSSSVLSSLHRASKTFVESRMENSSAPNLANQFNNTLSFPKKICTVEELEKNLIKNSQQNSAQVQHQQVLPQPTQTHHGQLNAVNLPQVPGQQRPLLPLPGHPGHPGLPGPQGHPFHPLLQHPNARLPPPGLPPMNIPPPPIRHLPPPLNPHPLLPPNFRMMPHHPHLMPPNGTPRPPGFMYPVAGHHNFSFPPPPPMVQNRPLPKGNQLSQVHGSQQLPNQQQNQQQQQYSPQRQHQQHNNQRTRHDSGNYRNNQKDQDDPNRDDYAGLMTAKDKQWLLNIQLLQLNTGTPYFDDYYYTIYKERKAKSNKENNLNNERDRNGRFQNNNNGRQRRNSERQDNNTLTPRVYTPLQFENSLGKLQCGSVTAPRKIIDMDIVTPDKDQEISQPTKDSRKTKQLLLELESLYSLFLKAEDIKNPMFISNMEKWREMKQKQRLRELEQAPTPEQKQEVLRLFKLESEPVVENQYDYIVKIVNGLLQDDKFSSFVNIRKGKMLLLRLLPYLSVEQFALQILEIWSKLLLSLPIIGRRDTAGDNILPKFYPYFKRFAQSLTMSALLELVSGLIEVVKQENSRSTPLSHVGKAPLYFILLNKFGVSCLVVLLVQAENLFLTTVPSAEQSNQWANFLVSWAKYTDSVTKVAVPLEAIPSLVFTKHVSRFSIVTAEKVVLLQKYFVDVAIIN